MSTAASTALCGSIPGAHIIAPAVNEPAMRARLVALFQAAHTSACVRVAGLPGAGVLMSMRPIAAASGIEIVPESVGGATPESTGETPLSIGGIVALSGVLDEPSGAGDEPSRPLDEPSGLLFSTGPHAASSDPSARTQRDRAAFIVAGDCRTRADRARKSLAIRRTHRAARSPRTAESR